MSDIAAVFGASKEDILLAHIKLAWPYMRLDDQKRWCEQTNYSKTPTKASEELQQKVQDISFDIAQQEERYGDYHRFMNTAPRSHNNAPYWYEFSTFERCAQQIEFAFDCPLSPPPHQQSEGGKLVTKIVGLNGATWREEDYCAYVIEREGEYSAGRYLVIQENDFSHVDIKLRRDVSNAEALRAGQALFRAIAAPPEPMDWS
jgi:hypothetical protein